MIKKILLMVIIIFIVCLILQHRVDNKNKEKYKTAKTILSVVLAILLGIESTLIYDFFVNGENVNKEENKEETQQSDEQKVLYPNIVVATEEDGNFLFELEQKEGRTVYGFEISISFPYSDYATVIIWEYEGPQWFSVPAGEYEISIYNHVDYYEKYPIKIEEHGNTHIYLPVYDYRG